MQAFVSVTGLMLDSSPQVQTAACSAITEYLDQSKDTFSEPESESILQGILKHVNEASRLYGEKNGLILCDVIAGVVERFPVIIKSPDYLPYFLPFVLKKFGSSENDSASL